MKGLSKILAVAFLLGFISINGVSQNYITGLGVRLGSSSGPSIKYFVNDRNALEGLLSFHSYGIRLTGLYEWQKQIVGIENFDWFVGGGGHFGFENNHYWDNKVYYSSAIVGFDFILGVEYTFKSAPFTLGADWKPSINIIGYNHWWGSGIGITFRYNFH